MEISSKPILDGTINPSSPKSIPNSSSLTSLSRKKVPREINDEQVQQAVDRIKAETTVTIATPDISSMSEKYLTHQKTFFEVNNLQQQQHNESDESKKQKLSKRDSIAVVISREVWNGGASANSSSNIASTPKKVANSLSNLSENNKSHSKFRSVKKLASSSKLKDSAPVENEEDRISPLDVHRPSIQQVLLLKNELNNRKSKSLSELNVAGENSVPEAFKEHYEKRKFKSKKLGSNLQRSVLGVDQKEHAATTIQRFWRYHRLRIHFNKILDNVQAQNSNNQETDLDTKRQRRRSTLLWMIAKEFSKSSEQLKKPVVTLNPVSEVRGSIGVGVGYTENTDSEEILASSESVNETGVLSEEETPLASPSPLRTQLFPNADPEMIRKRITARCINEFNVDANKGMKNLLSNSCISGDSESIAKFLLKEMKLSKTKIGEYLGAGEDLQNRVLRDFINQLDFAGLEFDTALRELLKTFRLPGEAQKIDRIMNEFAKRYCANNPTVFSSADTAYVLAYSLIMLNTDAHNPNVKKKMTLQDFLRNNRGIDNKQNLPEEFMKKLYSNIVNNEIKMDEYDNVYKVTEIVNQVAGKFENIVESHRRFVREFSFHQIPDYSKSNSHRHDRIIFLFNDLMLITKPKTPVISTTSHSFNVNAMAEAQNLTLPLTTSSTFSTMKPEPGKYLYRYTFNMIQLTIVERPDNTWHQHVVELTNPTGRLITMGFFSAEEKSAFIATLKELIDEVSDMEEEKMNKLRRLTTGKSVAARALIEEIYSFDDEGAMNRFSKYTSLRNARNVLTSAARVIRGKRKIGGPQREIYPEIKPIENMLAEFSVHVMLGKPTQSPDETQQTVQQNAQNADIAEETAEGEVASPVQDRKVPSTSVPAGVIPRLQLPANTQANAQEKRKRRNTYTAGILK